MKVDLGCGINKKKEGYIGVDQFEGFGVDIVCDIDKGISLEDNTVDKLYSSHFLEHVKDFIKTMEEIYRICKPNAEIEIKVPHFSGISGYCVFHKRFFRYDSFDNLDKNKRRMFVTDKCDIEIISKRIIFDKRWYMAYNYIVEPLANYNKFTIKVYEGTFLRNLFPAFELHYKLRVKKEDLNSQKKPIAKHL